MAMTNENVDHFSINQFHLRKNDLAIRIIKY